MDMEICWHGRGGQGVVTASEILAETVVGEGKYVKAFPEFGPERMGAPIRAFTRISEKPIRVHTQVYEPDVVIVLGGTLIGKVDVTKGLKKGGTIVLVGSCREGLGEKTFEEWILAAEKPADLISRIQREFRLGGHKAAAIAMVLENAGISLVSKMDPALVRKSFLEPYEDLQKAFDDAFAKQGEKATVLVMPYGGSTLPRCTND